MKPLEGARDQAQVLTTEPPLQTQVTLFYAFCVCVCVCVCQSLSLIWSPASKLVWLASKSQSSAWIYLLSAGIRATCLYSLLSHRVLGIELASLCLQGALPTEAFLQSPLVYF